MQRSRGDDLLEKRGREIGALGSKFDEKVLTKLVAALERRTNQNVELRLKYSNQPERFMDSEIELDAEIKNLQALAAFPEYYPLLIRLQGVPLLLGLFTHENVSIVRDVTLVLSELLDADAAEDKPEEAVALAEELLRTDVIQLLRDQVLKRCKNEASDTEEADCVFHALTLLENLMDLKPQVAETLSERKGGEGGGEGSSVMEWLIARISAPENDSNRVYSSEILAILLQNSDKNKGRLAEFSGLESLLQAIARYRKVEEKLSSEEEEYLENLFDALCAAAMLEANKEELLKAEAMDLMVIMMKKRALARLPAMKVCNFALTDCKVLCEQFVASLGLGPLFGFFMGKGFDKSNRKRREQAADMQENVISIVANLLQKLPVGSKRNRVLAKFAEQDCEKLDRLVELWHEYKEKLGAATEALDTSDDAELEYLELMDSGLYVLQQLAVVKAYLWASGDPNIQKRLLFVLQQYGYSLMDISTVLRRQFKFMYELQGQGTTVSSGVDEDQKSRLEKLIKYIESYQAH
jgi:beta-catenin-like protein 1